MPGNDSHAGNATEPLLSIALYAAIRQGESCGPGPDYPPFLPFVNNGIEARVQDREILGAVVEHGLSQPARGETPSHSAPFIQNDDAITACVQPASGEQTADSCSDHYNIRLEGGSDLAHECGIRIILTERVASGGMKYRCRREAKTR